MTKKYIFPIAVTSAFLLGASAVGFSVADSDDTAGMPAAKRSVVEAAGILDPGVVAGAAWDGNPFAAIENEGSALDISAVKAAIPGILTARSAEGRVSGTLESKGKAAQRSASLSTVAVQRRAQNLTSIEVASLAGEDLENLNSSVAQAIESENPNWLFTSNEFVLEKWQGVRISGDTARAILVGHAEWQLANGTLKVDEPLQHKVTLVRDATARYGWLLASSDALTVVKK